MDIHIATGDIADFEGDIIVVPCSSELTYKKFGIVQNILDKGGQNLVKELSAIGWCEIGNVAITKGYKLQAKNIIWMPIYDNTEDASTNYIGLHQSLRNAFILAELYEAKSVAIANITLPKNKRNFFERLWNQLLDNNKSHNLNESEIEATIIAISKDFGNTTIKEIFLYK